MDVEVISTIRMGFTLGWVVGPVLGTFVGSLFGLRTVLLLTAALLATILVNGMVLRRRFAPLEELIATMERVDLAHPGVRAHVRDAESQEVARLQHAFNRMLARVEEERAKTSRAVLRGQEEERARIARDLHDEANQSLTGLLLRLEAASHDAPPELAAELRETWAKFRPMLQALGVTGR